MTWRPRFSPARFWAMVVKEFVQMRRDRLTFGMMIGVPLLQLVLFGYAINSDPRHMSAAVLAADHGPQSRTVLYAMRTSTYFDFVREVETEAEAHAALARGEVQFVVTIPENFGRDLLRGDRPVLLVEADATDPAATSNAIGSLRTLVDEALRNDLKGPPRYDTGLMEAMHLGQYDAEIRQGETVFGHQVDSFLKLFGGGRQLAQRNLGGA